MATFIGADAAKLAGLQVDMLQKMRDGKISLEDLEKFVRGELAPTSPPELVKPVQDACGVTLDWQKAYESLGMAKEFKAFTAKSPLKTHPGFWTVPVIKGATCNKVVDALRKLDVSVYLYADDLDKTVTKNVRTPDTGNYLVNFHAFVEADQENANQSANQREGKNDITLLERLLLELAYFLATKEHLDVDNVTLCAGSRSSDGSVPDMDWDAGGRKVYVRWDYPGDRSDILRARSAVSLS